MDVITLSAAYGAGGSRVGPALAERLGVPFFDRAIPVGVAERLQVPLEEALGRDETVASPFTRALMRLAPMGQVFGAPAATPADVVDEDAYRRTTEAVMRERVAEAGGVVLGRAGALVLRDVPDALHVRLDGPPERRIAQAAELEGVDAETARRHQDETDRAREAYVERFYRVDARDCRLYHLVLDSTVFGLDAVVEMILQAREARR